MTTCKCYTKNGNRCTRLALSGSNYCKQHIKCKTEVSDEDEIQSDSLDFLNSLKSLSEKSKILLTERNFYFNKLNKIEAYANTMPEKYRNDILKILVSRKSF